ncbi:MAG: flagellar biosynthesis protein FlhB [Denitrovibrio sp.]|nr:MAG: flagellar biosynthesis protein FlhB [Denitrovibrio sp.]
MAGEKDEKTEQATGKKLQEARSEGKVAQSKELSSAATLLGTTFFFLLYGPYLMKTMGLFLREIFTMTHYPINSASLERIMVFATVVSAKLLAPFFIMVLILGVGINLYQVGFMITPKALKLKFEQLNPVTGWGKFFSKKSLAELLKSLFKIFAISYLAYYVVRGKLGMMSTMADMDVIDIITIFSHILFEIMWKIGLMVTLMAIADYIYQKWQFAQDMKMAKHEVKEERKQMEGDPKVKGRIRQIQRDMARQRMMDDVPKSDVVVTNPTHYAVALSYSLGDDKAPIVVAKGQRLVALRIREIARENGVLVHEAPPIARSLFKTVDIGDEIPENLYKAVAEILALVDKFKSPS